MTAKKKNRLEPGTKREFVTVVRFERQDQGGKQRPGYVVRCVCGTEKFVQAPDLERGRVRSCGCKQNELRLAGYREFLEGALKKKQELEKRRARESAPKVE